MGHSLIRDVSVGAALEQVVNPRNPTDEDIAYLFAERFRDVLAFDLSESRWLRYKNGVYSYASEPEAKSVVFNEFLPLFKKEAASAVQAIREEDDEAADAADRVWQQRIAACGSARGVDNLTRLASYNAEMQVRSEDFDSDPDLLNTPTGVFNLQTGVLSQHSPSYLMSQQTAVAYDPRAACPTFEAFLDKIVPEADIRDYMHRMLGYSITGHVSEQIMAFCLGDTGGNGKSTLFEIIRAVLGSYSDVASPKLLSVKNSEHTTELHDLKHKRFVVIQELDESPMDEGKLKSLTGDGTFKARKMHHDNETLKATHKFWAFGNNMPVIKSGGQQISRRFRIFDFAISIPLSERDKTLAAKIIANEGAGVLSWLIRGCFEWQKRGLADLPEKMSDLAIDQIEGQDSVKQFFEERTRFSIKYEQVVKFSEIFQKYTVFCNQYNTTPVSKNRLGRALGKLCTRQHTKVGNSYVGIEFNNN